jgi:hypothetical protein
MGLECHQQRPHMKTKRALTVLAVASATIAAVRLLVLFAESWTLVRAERAADNELLNLCRREENAAASAKFRAACLSARSDSAAPLLLKALLKSVSSIFADFAEAFSSPTKLALLVLFTISGLSAPLLKFVLKTFAAGMRVGGKEDESDSEDEQDRRVLVLAAPSAPFGPLHRMRRKLTQRKQPAVLRADVEEDDGEPTHGERMVRIPI